MNTLKQLTCRVVKALALTLPFLPFLLYAKVAFAQGLVPCDGSSIDPCGFNDFIDLIRNVVDFLMFKVAVPLSAILFAYAGFLMMFAGGDEGKIKRARAIFWWVFVGIVITLSAWLIVKTITSALLKPGFSLLSFTSSYFGILLALV